MTFDHGARRERLWETMGEKGVDVALFSVGPDLLYLSGYETRESERLTVLVVRKDGEPVLLVPELEAPRVERGDIEVVAWRETEDPVELAVAMGGEPRRAAVADHMWSAFVLDFQERWPDVDWLPASELTRKLRMRKDRVEIEALRRAARAIDGIMERIPAEVPFTGRTERDVARDLATMTIDAGHDTADFTIVASGPNGASPHHEPGARVIENGDLVVCDFGGRWEGYYSDSTRTFSVGVPAIGQIEIHEIVHAANEAARATVRPGVACEAVDRSAREVIEDAGYGDYFVHRTGHGIGLEVHEHPYIVEGDNRSLEPGMAFSVEPGIYLPGRLGVRIEDIVVCKEDGVDVLNTADRSLAVVA